MSLCGRSRPGHSLNTLILLVDNDSSWSPIVWAMERGGESADDGRVVIEDRRGWFAIHPDQSVLDDFTDDERADALAALVAPSIFIVEWRGDAPVEAFVDAAPEHCRAFIDNDHGVFAPITVLKNAPLATWARAVTLA